MNKEQIKQLKISNKNLTIENCPKSTYWLNKKTGTIVRLYLVQDERNTELKQRVYTENTERERSYEYTWNELVSKFLCIRNENITNDQYEGVINNKELSSWYKFATKKLPRYKKHIKAWNKFSNCKLSEKQKNMLMPMINEMLLHKSNFENCFEWEVA